MPMEWRTLPNWTEQDYTQYVTSKFNKLNRNVTEKVLEYYAPSSGKSMEYLFTSLVSDMLVNCPNDVLSDKAAMSVTSGLYRYVMTSSPSRPVHLLGFPFAAKYAAHMWDFLAAFDLFNFWMEPSESDIEFGKMLRDNFLNFAKYGKPLNLNWKPFPGKTALISENAIHAIDRFKPEVCKFWNQFFSYAWIN